MGRMLGEAREEAPEGVVGGSHTQVVSSCALCSVITSGHFGKEAGEISWH